MCNILLKKLKWRIRPRKKVRWRRLLGSVNNNNNQVRPSTRSKQHHNVLLWLIVPCVDIHSTFPCIKYHNVLPRSIVPSLPCVKIHSTLPCVKLGAVIRWCHWVCCSLYLTKWHLNALVWQLSGGSLWWHQIHGKLRKAKNLLCEIVDSVKGK